MQYLRETFSLDSRSLGLFRIGLGIVICYDLLALLPDIDAFFGPDGVYPAYLSHWSFHGLVNSLWFTYVLFIINALLAVLLILGYYTRPVTILCWLMAVSLAHRNPLVMFLARDYALILFLMWGMFLPLGQNFSLDSLRKKTGPLITKTFSMGSVGFICSLMMIYLLSGWFKIHPSWNQDLSALNYVFNNKDFVTTAGVWLLQFPSLLKVLTWLTVFIERFGILLLLVPFNRNCIRYLLIIVFCVFHLSLWATTIVDWFALIMIIAWLALIPFKSAAVDINKNKWINGLAGAVLIFMMVCTYKNAEEFFLHTPKSPIFKAARIVGLDFPWRLFSPSPPLVRRHYYFNPPFDLNKKNYRWIFLLNNQTDALMPFLKNYLIRDWNKTNPYQSPITDAIIYSTEEKILP